MNVIENFIDKIGRTVSYFYFFAVIISMWEIVLRWIFNSPTIWAHELVICACGITYLLSGGIVTKEKLHIRITTVYGLMSKKIKWYLDLLAYLIGIISIGLLIQGSLRQSKMAIKVWERTGSAWDPPLYALIKPAITVGAILVIISTIIHLVRHLKDKNHNEY